MTAVFLSEWKIKVESAYFFRFHINLYEPLAGKIILCVCVSIPQQGFNEDHMLHIQKPKHRKLQLKTQPLHI